VNFKTVRWTVLKEGTPCKRGRAPLESAKLFSLKPPAKRRLESHIMSTYDPFGCTTIILIII
ncbi:MAG: hypothetical protein ILA24_02135, partial [Ruminococcus sp.]|nr:hypothetical protein [Ruminococcus sp.]